jgi:hypothetical protein
VCGSVNYQNACFSAMPFINCISLTSNRLTLTVTLLNGGYWEANQAATGQTWTLTLLEYPRGSGRRQLAVRYGEANEEPYPWPTAPNQKILRNLLLRGRRERSDRGGILEFPGFSGHVGVFFRLFRIPQDLLRLNGYDGALGCRRIQCSQISRRMQVHEFCRSSF